MSEKLAIRFSEEQTAMYLRLAAEKTEAEVQADCEPSGSTITIDVSPFGAEAYCNGKELGDVTFEMVGSKG